MATQNIYSMVDTWNSAGTTFTGIGLSVTDTASAAASALMDLRFAGGTARATIFKDMSFVLQNTANNGVSITAGSGSAAIRGHNGNSFSLGSASGASLDNIANLWMRSAATVDWNGDLILARDAADTLAQRRGTNAQAFRVYNTFTDASNYERGTFGYVTNRLTIGHQIAGTGADRAVDFVGQDFAWKTTAGTPRWYMLATGHFVAATDNTYDIGASGASRPRSLYVGTNLVAGGGLYLGSTGAQVGFQSNGGGILQLANGTLTDFSRLQFGGTTSSFPALKRNATALETKLADDSAYAPHAMQFLDVTDGITAPASATGRARIYVDTADGDLKIIFADGTIKTIVVDT